MTTPWGRPRHGLILVLSIAALVRLWVGLDAADAPFWQVPVVDEIAHLHLAESIANGEPPVHGAYYTTPGYGYFLALLLQMGGQVPTAKVLQLLAGVASCGLLFVLGRRWFGVGAGVVAGLLWAVYPSALLHELLLLKPALTVLLVLLALVSCARPEGAPPWRWALGGLALGLAALLRGELLVVGLALALAGGLARWRRWPGAPGWAGSIALVAALLAVIAVPTAQNLARGGGFVPIAYSGGTNFYIGNHAGADGSYVSLRPERSDALFEEEDAVQLAQQAEGRPLRPAEVSRYWWGRGLRWWGDDPGGALGLTLKKLLLVWGGWQGHDVMSPSIAGRWVRALANPLVQPAWMLPLALLGLGATRRRRELWPLWSFLLASWLSLALFFLFDRFRLPLTAVALPFAGAAVAGALSQWRSGRRPAVLLGGLALVGFSFLLALPRIDRNDTVLRVNVGGMLMQQGRYEEALREFQIVRGAAPGAGRIDINLATAQHLLGRTSESLRSVQRALQFLYREAERTGRPAGEELRYCHELAGDLQMQLRAPGEAVRHYEAALRLEPGNPRLSEKLAGARGVAGP